MSQTMESHAAAMGSSTTLTMSTEMSSMCSSKLSVSWTLRLIVLMIRQGGGKVEVEEGEKNKGCQMNLQSISDSRWVE